MAVVAPVEEGATTVFLVHVCAVGGRRGTSAGGWGRR